MNPAHLAVRRALLLLGAAATALAAAGCATRATSIDAQWVNPQFRGAKAVRSVMVFGLTRDGTTRRLFEDRMVAQLSAAGVRAVQSYMSISEDGLVGEARMKEAIARTGVTHVLQTRIINTSQTVTVTPGMVAGPGWGPGWNRDPWGRDPWGRGWGGFASYQNAVWGPPMMTQPRITTTDEVHADTRLFESRDAEVLWVVSTTTTLGFDTVPQIIDQFVDLIVNRMKLDGLV